MKSFFSVIVFCIALSIAHAGAMPLAQKEAGNEKSLNVIQFYGQSFLFFQRFWKQQQQLVEQKEGQLKIFHFGDSHLQAGWFPHRMRQHYQSLHKDFSQGHRGFLFPYAVAKSNNPANYQIEYSGEWSFQRSTIATGACSFGLCGLTVSTRDSQATITLRQEDAHYAISPFTRIRVFHSISPLAPKLQLHPSENILFQLRDESYGFTLFLLKKPSYSFRLCFENDSAADEISLYGFSLENTDPGTSYSTLAANGASTQSLLRLNLLEQQLFILSPHCLIFSLGTNDVYTHFQVEEFKNRYAQLLQRVRSVLPEVPILLTTPGDALRDRQWEIEEMPELIGAMRELAEIYDCALWDFNAVMGGKGSMPIWSQKGWAHPDKLHLLRKGYEYQGDRLFEAMQDAYNQYLKIHSR